LINPTEMFTTELQVDASQANTAIAEYETKLGKGAAAARRMQQANAEMAEKMAGVPAAMRVQIRAHEDAEKTLNRLTNSFNQVSRAERDYERFSGALETARRRGVEITELQIRTLERLRVASDAAAQAAGRQTQAELALTAAQRRINQATGVGTGSDYAARAADIAAYGQELDRLRAKFNPLAAAQQQYRATLAEINQAARIGALSEAERAAAIQRTKDSFAQQVTALRGATNAATTHTGAVKLQGYQVANLGQQLQDVGVQLSMGTNPFIILAQQGPQITSAMGGVRNALALTLSFINPLTVGIAATAAAIGIVSARAIDLAGEARTMGVALRAMGKDAEITAGQMHRLVESMRDLGVDKGQARAAALAAVRAPGASAAGIQQALALAPDTAAAFGGDVADAAKQIAEASVGSFDAIQRLSGAYRLLSAEQLNQVRLMLEQGDKAGAVAIAYDALAKRVKDAAENSLSPASKLWNDLGRAWDHLIDRIAQSEPVLNAVKNLADNLDRISGRATPAQRAAPLIERRDFLRSVLGDTIDTPVDQLPWWRRFDPAYRAMRSNYDSLNAEIATIVGGGVGSGGGAGGNGGAGGPRAGGSIGGGGPVPPSGDPGFTAGGAAAVAAATAAYEDQNKVLSASIGVRDLVRARVEAEREAITKGYTETEKARLIDERVATAKTQMATAANDNLTAIRSETEATLAVAEAYRQSLAAGRAAEAAAQARSEKLRNVAVDEKALADAIRDRAAAQGLVDVAKSAEDMKFQADMAERAAAAARSGAEASQEAARQAEVEALRRQALATATDATRAAVLKEIAAYDDESRRRLRNIQEMERERAIRQAGYDVQIAAAQAQAATIADPSLRRQAELAIERQQKINELTLKYGSNIEQIRKELALFDQAQIFREQERFWEDIRRTAQDVSRDVSDFLVEGFVNAEKGGRSTFRDLWDGALAGAKRFAARVAATFLEQKIIMPIAMQVVGAAPNLFGIPLPVGGTTAGGAGAPGAASGFFSWGGASTAGAQNWAWVTGAPTTATETGVVYSTGPAAGMPANGFVMPGLGQIAGGGLVGLGIGAGIAGMQPFGNRGMAGGAIGGTIGGIAGSFFGPAGTIVGSIAGGLISSAFGPNRDPRGFAHIGIADGRFALTGSGQKHAKSNPLVAQVEQMAAGLNALADQFGLTIGGTLDIHGLGFGKWLNPNRGYGNLVRTPEELLRAITASGVITGDATMNTILRNTRAGDVAGLASDLEFGRAVQDLNDNITPAAKALREINEQFGAMKKRAEDLGLATHGVDKAWQQAIQSAKDMERLPIESNVLRSTGAAGTMIADFLRGQALSDTSSLDPMGRLAEAQRQFGDFLSRVRGGDLDAVGGLTQSAQSLLSIGRGVHASSVDFANLEGFVRSSLQSVGQTITGERFIADQITRAIQLQTQAQNDQSAALREEVKSLKREMQLLRQELAA